MTNNQPPPTMQRVTVAFTGPQSVGVTLTENGAEDLINGITAGRPQTIPCDGDIITVFPQNITFIRQQATGDPTHA